MQRSQFLNRNTARILAARTYVSPRSRPLTREEQYTRLVAYDLKIIPTADYIVGGSIDVSRDVAAKEMARLIDGPCWLIPVPDRNGHTTANFLLAREIAKHVKDARIKDILSRDYCIESQCDRHKAGLGPLQTEEHHIIRIKTQCFEIRPIWFVDNVATSGNTIEACRKCLGLGDGLVFADAWETIKKGVHNGM